MSPTPETREEYSAKIPALQVLLALGWEYLPPAECTALRGGIREVLLTDSLVRELRERRFEWAGEEHRLSANAIEQIVRELGTTGIHEGLLTANERIYDKLTLGVTVTEFIDGKRVMPTIPLMDWEHPENNRFQVTEEFEVLDAGGIHKRIPDLVCFVNGIPLVVMEAKRPESGNPNKSMVVEGVSQQLRNQGNDEIPHLFAYAQLLLAISGTEGRYGTIKTPAKFWSVWEEEELDEARFHAVKNTPMTPAQQDAVFAERPARMREYFQSLWSKEMVPSSQDRLLTSLLSRDRLLWLIRYFMIFDKRAGKIVARHQQAFGVMSMLRRVTKLDKKGARQGGVIWHTTGSGKSFTMVFLCKAMLIHPELGDCRIIVVTDRVDLEKQLAKVFVSSGALGSAMASKKEGDRLKARSGKDLAQRIGQGTERIIFTIIDKFQTASRQKECFNPSDKLIVLIDEAHRSQEGETHERMRLALPNAAYIGFTGTPLLKKNKTRNRFGRIIHAYTMKKAVKDGTVTPLVYEERKPELGVNEAAIDNWFDKLTEKLSEKQKNDLKKKFAGNGAVYASENRIELIAWDIASHFVDNYKDLGTGLKAQLATESKLSAIRYHNYLEQTGLVSSAVVISPPDTREGHDSVDDSALPEVQEWFKKTVGHSSDAREYERQVIEDFGTTGDPDILIVVDKLLTGFDEPRNAVLYIDKPLKQHSLIQAIARVNRLHPEKEFGLLVDYRGILKELDTAIQDYRDLESNTQAGYDIDDLDGLYSQVSTEYKKLPRLHDKLWAIFAGVKNRRDFEQYRLLLVPKFEDDEEGNSFDANQKVREDFYQALSEFGMCLKLALASRSFYEDGSFSEKDIQTYKDDLRFFVSLRKKARQDAQETVDYSAYEKQIRKLVDKHVVGKSIDGSKNPVLVQSLLEADPEKWSREKTKNETEIIRSRMKKTVEQDLADDPYAQKVFSELIKEAIQRAESLFDRPLEQYAIMKELEQKLESRSMKDIPAELKENATARSYFGIFRLELDDDEKAQNDTRQLVEEALAIDGVVKSAMLEHSLSPKSMEAAIRKGLLPRLFELFGMDKAKKLIEWVIKVTRVRLSREAA